jgi:hypothetical protein
VGCVHGRRKTEKQWKDEDLRWTDRQKQASSGKVKPAAFGETPRNSGKKIVQVSQSDSDFDVDSESPETGRRRESIRQLS